jgi:hypothetical protein
VVHPEVAAIPNAFSSLVRRLPGNMRSPVYPCYTKSAHRQVFAPLPKRGMLGMWGNVLASLAFSLGDRARSGNSETFPNIHNIPPIIPPMQGSWLPAMRNHNIPVILRPCIMSRLFLDQRVECG